MNLPSILRKALATFFSIAVACTLGMAFAGQASAEPLLTASDKSATVAVASKSFGFDLAYYIDTFKSTKGASKVTATSSNKKVIHVENAFGSKQSGWGVQYTARKTGKATLTIKIVKKGKTSTKKVRLTAVKYSNPLSSAKFGGKKLTAGFSKGIAVSAGASSSKAQKLTVKPKSGWAIKSMSQFGEGTNYSSVNVKNGQKVDLSKGEISIVLHNKAKNQRLQLYIEPDGR